MMINDNNGRSHFHVQSLIFPAIIIVLLPGLYVTTLAQSLVLGDPSEYTMITAVLGIAHPPGYAFYTVLGKLFQLAIPIGDIPWRMHLLSAATATTAALALYGIIVTAGGKRPYTRPVGLLTALTGGTAVNIWQHAIHANPHIITGTFLIINIYLLTKWWAAQQTDPSANKWLYAFCISAGLGITHHPLTAFGFPAYALFILLVWFRQAKDWKLKVRDFDKSPNRQSPLSNPFHWRIIPTMLAFALLGLSVWLYYPLRSPSAPFGPTTMNTLNGFLAHVLARGLSESLPYFPLSEQPNRLIVFWSILRLQYTLPIIGLVLAGVVSLLVPSHTRPGSPSRLPLVLALFAFLGVYAFVISLRAQDIMAYLLGPLLVVALFAGFGLLWLTETAPFYLRSPYWYAGWLLVALVAGPVWQVVNNLPDVSLRNYHEGTDVVTNAFTWFDGRIPNATLLNNWEAQTPLWYEEYVNGRTPPHVTPVYISTAGSNPWLEGVFNHLPGGPVFTHAYRPEILAGTEFRLRPRGPYYQVAEPGDTSMPPELTPVSAGAEAIQIVGYELPQTAVTAGDYVPITLAMTTPTGTEAYYVPIIHVGNINYTFTTDSHLITPRWLPGEIIVERFDVALPHTLPAGHYPISVNLKNLSTDTVLPLNLSLGEWEVGAHPNPPETDDLLANFRQRVGLVSATARLNGRYTAPWSNPITAHPGDTIKINLRWRALAKAEESYTVFVHLIDLANQPIVALDYTPLGGAVPTHLWIPKWLPGQEMTDPYSLQIPPDLPTGQYLIEVGLYEMVGLRRLHLAADDGSIIGDRYILGSVIVAPDGK
ncbi:MAG: hypothetical protein Kow0080_19780 [Candidatus Promineifilaceae bacterium]